MEKNILKICEIEKGYEYEGPRFVHLGPFSGEEFRKEHLLPWLKKIDSQEKNIVDFIGTKMYSPSFLEESFGGAIREADSKKEADEIRKKLQQAKLINIDPVWKKKLDEYIKDAKYKAKSNKSEE